MEDLLAKYFAGEATAAETKEVEDWRGASGENARIFLETKKVWLSADQSTPNAKSFENLLLKMNKVNGRQTNWRVYLKYAAIFILVLGVVFLIYLSNSSGEPDQIIANELITRELPDGSMVTLQAGGVLKLGDFGERRAVELSGRAYFNIQEDKDSPFTITTRSARIQVTGTSFVVKSPTEKATEVIVESGSVELYQNPEAFNGSTMMINLEKGEMGQLSVGTKGIRKKKVRDQNYLAWKTGYLTFKNTTIDQVGLTLEDVYGIEVSFANDAIKHCRLTANYKNKTSEEVLNYLSRTFDFTYEQNGNRVVFSGEGCQ